MSEYVSLVLTVAEKDVLTKYLRKRPHTVSSTDDPTEIALQSIERKLKEDATNGANQE